MRIQHSSTTNRLCRYSELKSLNLNPVNPHLLGIAAADPFLRIYDRRMLSTGGWRACVIWRDKVPGLQCAAVSCECAVVVSVDCSSV